MSEQEKNLPDIKDFPLGYDIIKISTTSGNIVAIKGNKYEYDKPDMTIFNGNRIVGKFKLSHIEGFYFE